MVKMSFRSQILCVLIIVLMCSYPAVSQTPNECTLRKTLYESSYCIGNRERPGCPGLQRALALDCGIYECPNGVRGAKVCQDPSNCPTLFSSELNGVYCLSDDCCYVNATTCENFPRDVNTVMVHIQHAIGISVICDDGWTVIQRRSTGDVSFDRTYAEYEEGFGDPATGFWLGLKHVRTLLERGTHQIRFDFKLEDGTPYVAQYKSFEIGPASDGYRLSINRRNYDSSVSNAAGRSIEAHNGMLFTTKDHDRDICLLCNCAVPERGGWWYHACATANLNGRWLFREFNWGTSWRADSGVDKPLTFTEMRIRLA